VLLSNAWDHTQRQLALAHFHLDETDFRERHELVVSSFERGKIGLDEYLNRTVFYKPRSFPREEFKNFMFSLSQPLPGSLELARALARTGCYRMSTLNNESLELNLYRIEKFGLREIFTLFLSSCFVGLRKPEEGIYRLALNITQAAPQECCFIDDRALNLECAATLGMHVIRMENAGQLAEQLEALGVVAGS
jgi:putative hydrolase of the HAD superfamily